MTRVRKYLYGVATIFFIVILISNLLSKSDKNILGTWDRIGVSVTPTSMVPTPTKALPVEENSYPVEKIIDGDTIVALVGGVKQAIRLIGVNTPESVDPRRPVECFGNEASDKAKSLLSGQSVRLVVDPTQGERDKYGRLLRYVFRDDGLFINKQMIQDGYAYEYTYATPYQYQNDFRKAQYQAQQAQRGLWSPEAACGLKAENAPLDDKDCKDFQSQQEAQDFFTTSGGPKIDPHKLDSNRDGSVCESLP